MLSSVMLKFFIFLRRIEYFFLAAQVQESWLAVDFEAVPL